jgi:hypothetical protein
MVPAPAPASSPAQAPSPSPESQQAAGPESVAPEVENPPELEIDIPHDGTVVPCFQDPVCSSEQARIQSENVAEYKRRQGQQEDPGDPNLHNMCRQAVQSKTPLPEACRSLGG